MTYATYEQNTGRFTIHGASQHSVVGYAGRGEGRNNPLMQDVRNVGPLPRGAYRVSMPFTHVSKGPVVFRLTPSPINAMHGRSGFLIHGDNARGDASEGCIILPRYYRQMISRLGVRDLFVIDRHRLDCAAVQACGIAGTCVVPGAMCNEAEGCAA